MATSDSDVKAAVAQSARSAQLREGAPASSVSIDDKYTLDRGRAFMTGIQALVRLPLEQHRRDKAAGLDTAGFISGYRGSPLGAYDQQLWAAKPHLAAHQVKFQEGVNEELAATACWGTQQVGLHAPGKHDGVFAIWYGKGPGVDRSGDALRHANFAGSSPHGGCLAILGDDHICESSTTAHQSEFAMVDAMIPVLNPAGVQEILDYGLLGFALSRYSGMWVALKCVHDTVESSGSIELDPDRVQPVVPADYTMPEGGLNIRWPDLPLEQEARLHDYKHDAVRAFARANKLDRIVLDSPDAKLGIVTTGKSYLDVRQALDDLGINEQTAPALGVRLYKVGLAYPMEPDGARAFAAGLDQIIVVEEKRALLEVQIKEVLFDAPAHASGTAPSVIGKRDEHNKTLFRAAGNLDPNHIAAVIGRRLPVTEAVPGTAERLAEVEARLSAPALPAPAMLRTPYFCSGCPHNTSTRVPQGSRALAGIGCHYMAQWMDRETAGYTQMGGEGASWVGEAPFSTTGHIFQNIGDGTYFHSGLLAIRYAISSGVNVTFKILFNDAVAMTGGQPMDGPLTVPRISQQVTAEGARQVVVVTDEPEKYDSDAGFARGVTVRHRDELDAVQRELREVSGATVIIYDQTCASEKRRRRKRGTFPDPDARAFINSLVCEGCGDCGVQSNCVAVAPKETAFGRKRVIDQSACNKDFSCVRGFCPSFVTVRGGKLRKADAKGSDNALFDVSALPEATTPSLDAPYNVVVTGVGGTGVVTIGALIGMAAHIEGKGVSVLDMLGLAQKGGSVVSHIRIAARPDALTSTRVADGSADLLLGGDLVVAASNGALSATRPGHTRAVVNLNESMTGDFTRNADAKFPGDELRASIAERLGEDRLDAVAASRLATALLGDSIGANLFLLGLAWQRGTLPLARASIERAIELNGVAIEMNQRAFALGRRAAVDLAAVTAAAAPLTLVSAPAAPPTLAAMLAERREYLGDYQDDAYAARYVALVEKVQAAEKALGSSQALTQAVARYYFKVLAYKDEYEVARLHSGGAFAKELEATFEGDYTLEYHLAPPLVDAVLGLFGPKRTPTKRTFGPWMGKAFGWLARGKQIRGTAMDVFGYTAERRAERAAIGRYEADVAMLLDGLSAANLATAIAIASVPELVRGFGHVKDEHRKAATLRRDELLAEWRSQGAVRDAA